MVAALVVVTVMVTATSAAGSSTLVAAGSPTLGGVIDGLRLWLVGLLATLATLFLTFGGVRYLTANGDPGQVEKAKTALRSAMIGYALAALAPLLVEVLRSLVGG
jgi:hypothetical protein